MVAANIFIALVSGFFMEVLSHWLGSSANRADATISGPVSARVLTLNRDIARRQHEDRAQSRRNEAEEPRSYIAAIEWDEQGLELKG